MSTLTHRRTFEPADRIGIASLVIFAVSFVFGITCLTMASAYDDLAWLIAALFGGALYVVGFITGIVGAFKTRGGSNASWLGMLANGMLLPFVGPVWWLFASPVIANLRF